MRKILAISMPDEMYSCVTNLVSKAKYGSVSEYIRELIRNDRQFAEAERPPEQETVVDSPATSDFDYSGIFTVKSANEWIEDYRRSEQEARSTGQMPIST